MEVLCFLRTPERSVITLARRRALFVALISLGACQSPEVGSGIAVDTAEIVLGGKGSIEHVVPSRVVVRTGGELVFRTVDHRVHTIAFVTDSLGPAALDFLRTTGQLRSPPLVSRGTVYRISLAGAPPGYYPFVAEGPGPPVRGGLFIE